MSKHSAAIRNDDANGGLPMWQMVNNCPIFYEEYGEGMPLLCIHGFPEDHRVLSACVEPNFGTSDQIRRIYMDMPGMGKSPVNPAIRNADDMLAAIAAFINQVIGNREYLLLGQSYGGYLSLGMAFRLAQPIAGLFLLCPCIVADRAKRTLPLRSMVKQEEIPLQKGESEQAYSDFLSYATIATKETWQRYQSEILPGLLCADSHFVQSYQKEGYGFSFEEKLRDTISFNKPTCFLTGGMDDCVGFEDAYQLQRRFLQSTFTILDSAGHNLQIEYPHHFDFAFQDWIKRATIGAWKYSPEVERRKESAQALTGTETPIAHPPPQHAPQQWPAG